MIECEAMMAENQSDADTIPMQVDPPPLATSKNSNPADADIVTLDDDDDVENVPPLPKAGHSVPDLLSSKVHAGGGAESAEKQMETEKVIKATKLMMQNLTRKELEDIVLNRTVEAVNSHSNMGSLRNKFLQLQLTKDKLFQKSTSLQKQVNELTKAVRQLTENSTRNPKSFVKSSTPLRFFRSVGLQVGIELSAGKPLQPPPIIIPTRNLPKLEPLKSANNDVNLTNSSKQIKPLQNNVNGIVSIGQKRSLTTVPAAQQNNNATSSRPSRPNIINHNTPAILNVGKNNLNNSENIENKPKNGLVVAQKVNQGQPGQIVYGSNGELQVRLLSQSGVQILSGLQFVRNPVGVGANNANKNQAIRLPIQVSQQQTAVRSQVPGQITIRQNGIGNNRQPVQVVSQQPQLQQQPQSRPIRLAIRPAPAQQQAAAQQRVQTHRFILPPLPPPHLSASQTQVMMARRGNKEVPPRPTLDLKEEQEGIVLSWNLSIGPNNAEINTYQIYACQEPLGPRTTNNNFPVATWKRVGDVKALPLPMACTLSQFTDENRYHFIVRALDVYNRAGVFCEARSIVLMRNKIK